jgi:hypothetical protein
MTIMDVSWYVKLCLQKSKAQLARVLDFKIWRHVVKRILRESAINTIHNALVMVLKCVINNLLSPAHSQKANTGNLIVTDPIYEPY